jgi:hypothetical protein
MTPSPEQLYLELLKKTLSFTLWPEPPRPVTDVDLTRLSMKRLVFSPLLKWLDKHGLAIVQKAQALDQERLDGRIWPQYAETMIGLKRLDNLEYCIKTVLSENIEGDLIETGVWRGGACIFMRAVLAASGVDNRKIYVADSFEGLPKPDLARYPADEGDRFHSFPRLAVPKEEVENNFRKYGLLDNQVVFLKGWFNETLPQAPIEKLAIVRLDGDMYGSTMEALESLYPKLVSGGFCIVDDYALSRCKMAVDDYRARCGIVSDLIEIDWTGRYWRKH